MWFYGWGFYALGQDDTLERRLTGQPTRSHPPPKATADDANGSFRTKSPIAASPRQAQEGGGANGSNFDARARAEAGDDGEVVIDVDHGTGERNGTDKSVAASDLGKGDNGSAGLKQRISRVLLSPNIIAVATGVVIAMIAPLQEMLFDNPRAILRPLGGAFEVGMFGVLACFPVPAAPLPHTQPRAHVAARVTKRTVSFNR